MLRLRSVSFVAVSRLILGRLLIAMIVGVISFSAGIAVLAQTTAPIVTGSVTSERVRFVAPASVVQIKVEVISDSGSQLFEASSKGNVFDWTLQGGDGQLVADGGYVCVITIKSLSGKLSQRIGTVSVNAGRAVLLAKAQLTAAQEAVVGPIEENAVLTVLKPGDIPSATVVAHDGKDGQVTSTTGALTFRTGDVFTGTEKERMRITEDGRVGIGTDNPEATFDVAGTVRAGEGFKFSNGSTLNVNEKGALKVTDADGNFVPSAAGTGTINRLAKWNETGGAGTLTDAAGAEVSGATFFGLNNSGLVAPLFAGSPTFHVLEVGATGSKSPLTLAGGSGVMEFWKDLGGGVANPAAAVAFGMARPGIAATNDMVFSTYTPALSWNERMRVTSGGNVGIGTPSPTSSLTVAGVIESTTGGIKFPDGSIQTTATGGGVNAILNQTTQQPSSNFNISGTGKASIFDATTQYNIGGVRVFWVPGINNLFVGDGAGPNFTVFGNDNSFFGKNSGQFNSASNNSFYGSGSGSNNGGGSANSFFGQASGLGNRDGSFNSFFGTSAGLTNRFGDSNSFFGALSGQSNNTGSANSFFGRGSGQSNNSGSYNSFFGIGSGQSNYTGSSNNFIGQQAGMNNVDGGGNTFIGANSGLSNTSENFNMFIGNSSNGTPGITNATAIGVFSSVTQSNSLVLGSINGTNGATADTKVGIGTTAPSFKLTIFDSLNTGLRVTTAGSGGTVASFGGNGAFQVDAPGFAGGRLNVKENGNVGIGTNSPNAKLQVAGGSVYIQSPNSLVITSPNGACWFITVNNAGALSTISVTCP